MNIELIKLDIKYKDKLSETLDEWINFKSENKDELTPYAIFKNDYHDFDNYLNNLEIKEGNSKLVPDSTFFVFDKDKKSL